MDFMPYVCLGDWIEDPNFERSSNVPNERFTIDLVRILVNSGAKSLELGIPFSDPIADGPTIQAASERSLKNGMTREKAFELIKKIRAITNIPLTVMTYYNIVFSYDNEKFIKKIKEAGANNLLCPDLPLEESEDLFKLGKKYGINIIFLIAPNSSEERIKKICRVASGFLYLVSSSGVTGVRKELPKELKETISRVKKQSKVPVVVGFGISNKDQIKELENAGADGFIIGSKIVDLYTKGTLKEIALFCKSLF